MFQVKKPEYVNKTFRMPQKDVSLNQLVTQCCRYALDHLDTDAD